MKRGVNYIQYNGKIIRPNGRELIISDKYGDYVFSFRYSLNKLSRNTLISIANKKMVL